MSCSFPGWHIARFHHVLFLEKTLVGFKVLSKRVTFRECFYVWTLLTDPILPWWNRSPYKANKAPVGQPLLSSVVSCNHRRQSSSSKTRSLPFPYACRIEFKQSYADFCTYLQFYLTERKMCVPSWQEDRDGKKMSLPNTYRDKRKFMKLYVSLDLREFLLEIFAAVLQWKSTWFIIKVCATFKFYIFLCGLSEVVNSLIEDNVVCL